MDIKDFVIKKLNEYSLEESDFEEPGVHKAVDMETFQQYLKNNIDNPVMDEKINSEDLSNISVENNLSLTKKLLKLGKLSIIPITLSMIVASMSFLDTPTSSKEKEINVINKIVQVAPVESKKTIRNNLLVKKPEIIDISNSNPKTIKTNITKSLKQQKDKKEKQLKPSSSTITNLMKNENEKMYKGIDKFSEPFWDIKQWTVGYGTSIEGINSQVKQTEEAKPKKGWVAKFREIHGNIPKNIGDLEPGENKNFPLGRISHNTSLAALEFFHKKNSESLVKQYKFIEFMPDNIKEVIYDMSFNMGSNFFSKFVKFEKNLKIAGKLLKKLKTKKVTSKEKLSIEKKINIYFTRAAKEIIDSDYFRDSHVKRKNKILQKQKQKQKTKKSFKYKNDYIEISRPYKMIMLIIQGKDKSLSSKKEKYAKKLINIGYKKYKNIVNESLLVDYIKQIILS